MPGSDILFCVVAIILILYICSVCRGPGLTFATVEDITAPVKAVKAVRKKKVKNYTSESKLIQLPPDDTVDTTFLITTEEVKEKVEKTAVSTKKAKKSSKKDIISSKPTGEVESSEDSESNISKQTSPKQKVSVQTVPVPTVSTTTTNPSSPLVLTVYGEPTPLSRHMVSRGHMYNPSAGLQKEFAQACASLLPHTPLTGPLEATLFFYFSRPKNHYGTGKNAKILKPLNAGNWHCKRKGKDFNCDLFHSSNTDERLITIRGFYYNLISYLK